MELFTENYFRTYRNQNLRGLSGLKNSAKNEGQSYNPQFDVFLSHSTLDKEVIEGIWQFLSDRGLKVYVYWIVDPKLAHGVVDKSNAELLRLRMDQSKSLIYASSPNAEGSSWMSWEVGYMDGRTPRKCAILPVVKHSQESFHDREFMDLYPKIELERLAYADKPIIFGGTWESKTVETWARQTVNL